MRAHEIEERIRNYRRGLVVAAEEVIGRAFSGSPPKPDSPTQFHRLASVCSEATCHEEIRNYLRYQAARGVWDLRFAEDVIRTLDPILDPAADDEIRIALWRRYAAYLMRAFVYQRARRAERRNVAPTEADA